MDMIFGFLYIDINNSVRLLKAWLLKEGGNIYEKK